MKNVEQFFANALMTTPVNFAFTNSGTQQVYHTAYRNKLANKDLSIAVDHLGHDFLYQTAGAAAIDLYLADDVYIHPNLVTKVDLGIALDYPVGLAGLILPRSSNGKQDFQIVLSNGTGLIDSDYKGTLWAQFTTLNNNAATIHLKRGERFAQILTIPYIKIAPNLVEWDSFKDSTKRGTLGLGEGTGSQQNA